MNWTSACSTSVLTEWLCQLSTGGVLVLISGILAGIIGLVYLVAGQK